MNDKDALKTDARKRTNGSKASTSPSRCCKIKEEAARLDQSLSWVVQRAWKIARLRSSGCRASTTLKTTKQASERGSGPAATGASSPIQPGKQWFSARR